MPSFVVDDAAGWTPLVAGGLPGSGVTPGTYGDSTHVAQVTVNAQGQVTAAASVGISGGGGGGSVGLVFAEVTADESTSSSTYTNLTTTGPAVTVTVGAAGVVWVGFACQFGTAQVAAAAVAVSGASTVAANDQWSLFTAASTPWAFGRTYVFTGLSTGSTTFTMQYRSPTSAPVDFLRRSLWAVPL